MYILPERRVVHVIGADARDFLNRVLTCRLDDLDKGQCRFGAFLTPQGKILTDMFVFAGDVGLIMDLPASTTEDTVRRLSLLKLRADVSLKPCPDYSVFASDSSEGEVSDAIVVAADPRIPSLHIMRGIRTSLPDEGERAPSVWTDFRFARVLPECGTDYDPSSVFPADVNMDLLNGVDFRKGCFVGQEVVSRMKRKTEVRKRTLHVRGPTSVQKGDHLMSEGSTLGEVLNWQGAHGLVLTRIDRMGVALSEERPIVINSQSAEVSFPEMMSSAS